MDDDSQGELSGPETPIQVNPPSIAQAEESNQFFNNSSAKLEAQATGRLLVNADNHDSLLDI